MVPVDHDLRRLRHGGDDRAEVGHDVAGIEHHVAQVDQIDVLGCCLDEARREGGEGHHRHAGLGCDPGFHPPIDLAAKTVELPVGRHDTNGRIQRSDQPHHELVRVGGEDDVRRIRQREHAGNVALCLRDDRTEDVRPLAVGEPGRVLPRLGLGIVGRIGPQVVRVRREMQPIGGEEPAE